jgi:hypothetical protein
MTLEQNFSGLQTGAERRRIKRVRVDLSGRLFEPGEEREAACKITDMSAGGALVVSEIVPPPQAEVVLYIDGFGRLEATVVRAAKGDLNGNSFGVRFNCSALKRDRIAEQLALYVSSGTIDQAALRRHERAATKGLARFTRANGDVVNCEVLDLSLGGVSLRTEVRPQIGELVLIGQMAGRVARIHENGIAIEFVTPPPDRSAPDQPPKLSTLR